MFKFAPQQEIYSKKQEPLWMNSEAYHLISPCCTAIYFSSKIIVNLTFDLVFKMHGWLYLFVEILIPHHRHHFLHLVCHHKGGRTHPCCITGRSLGHFSCD